MSVAFDGIGSLAVTFRCSGQVEAGTPVVLSDNETVAAATAGKAPAGVALHQQGYVKLPYTGTAPALGQQVLVADGSKGVKTAGSGETGRTCLVVRVDTEAGTVGLFL